MKFIFLLFGFTIVFGQNVSKPDSLYIDKRELFTEKFKTSNQLYIKEITSQYQGKTSKILKNNLEEFSEEFSTEIKEDNFTFDERFIININDILEEFKLKNPLVPRDMSVLISKNSTLNAYCLPNGTFVVNMGLYYWLKNEDQIAAVIAHEISHKILEHSVKSQVKKIEEDISKNSKDKIKEIKKEKYNKSSKAFQLYKSKIYANSEMRKSNEFQADSLGYVLLRNTKYNKLDYIETLKLTEKYDSIKPKGVDVETYKKVFDLPNQKFEEKWLKQEDFLSYNYELNKDKFDKDSIATHPEAIDRIKRLETLYPELKNATTNQPSESFTELESLAEINMVPNFVFFEEYGLGIYLCLYKIQQEKDEVYYKKMLGQIFDKIYVARKEYKLNRYLDQIDPKNNSESYMQFLSFMWNLKLEEIKNISDFYNQ